MSEQPTTAIATVPSVNWIAPATIQQGLELAKMMATAKLMPEHLRGDPGSCLLVLEQASRWGMSPFAVAQATAVVRGKLCFEGKLVAAVLKACGAIEGRLRYEHFGEGKQRGIKVTGVQRGEKEPVSITGTVEKWQTFDKDGKVMQAWVKDPDSMLIYRGTRQWARVYAPEAMLGVYTPDEVDGAMFDDDDPTVIPATAKPVVVPDAPPPAPPAPPAPETPPAPPAENGNGKANGKKAAAKKAIPELDAARDLYKTLGTKYGMERAGKFHDTLLAIYHVSDINKLSHAQLVSLAKDVAAISERIDDPEAIDALLDEWRRESAQPAPAADGQDGAA